MTACTTARVTSTSHTPIPSARTDPSHPCPGFTGQLALSTGHIDDRHDAVRENAREQFLRLSPWKECGDCAFIPVCAGDASQRRIHRLVT